MFGHGQPTARQTPGSSPYDEKLRQLAQNRDLSEMYTEFLLLPDERQEVATNPLQVQHVKAQARIKASQLCKFVQLKVQETFRQRKEPQPDLKPSDIKLYFFCKNGKRWYFEGGQRICHIIKEGYWSIEKTFIPVRQNENGGSEESLFHNGSNLTEGVLNAANHGLGPEFDSLIENYRPRELTDLERIYVMFKRDCD